MFDPTIYDNVKVVFEGEAYDLDAQGDFLITMREDMVNLADMSRSFTIVFGSQKGPCSAGFTLKSDILDFAGELRKLRLAEDEPGVSLLLWIDMPGPYHSRIAAHTEDIWSAYTESARLKLERRSEVPWEKALAAPSKETYRVSIEYRSKINESHMDQVGEVLAHFLSTVTRVEQLAATPFKA